VWRPVLLLFIFHFLELEREIVNHNIDDDLSAVRMCNSCENDLLYNKRTNEKKTEPDFFFSS
jgi:hypothetical protein